MSIPIYEKLKKSRFEFYENTDKVGIDISSGGTGKTWTINGWVINNNHNNVCYFNNHDAIAEIYHNISRFGGLNGQIDFIPNVNVLFGKNFILSEKQQGIYSFPPCLCKLYTNTYLFNIRNRGFLVYNYCRNNCPERHSCLYMENKDYTLKAYKIKTNNICMLPKAYIHTEIKDIFLNDFKDLITIFEESLFNTLYDEKEFYWKQINNYIDLVNDIIGNNTNLSHFWDPLENLLFEIAKYSKGRNHLKMKTKIKEIVKLINIIIDTLGKDPVAEIKKWNNDVKKLILTHERDIENNTNLMNGIIDIIGDMIKLYKINMSVINNFVIDKYTKKISYIINQKSNMIEIIEKSKKTIFNDASASSILFENLFPEYADTYLLFDKYKSKSPWKQVYTLNKYHAESSTRKYGSYPKYSLMVKNPKPDEKKFKPPFYDLIKIVENIFKYEYNQGKTKVLILAFKEYIRPLKSKLKDIINKLNLDIYWEYWYNLEGKNSYRECEYGISFGSPGWRRDVKERFNRMYHMPEKILHNYSTEQQLKQGMERLRPQLYKYTKIWYNLTNILAGHFINEVDLLPQLNDINLFEYMKKMGWCNKKILSTYLKITESNVGILMKKYEKDNIINIKKVNIGRGRPIFVYKYIGKI